MAGEIYEVTESVSFTDEDGVSVVVRAGRDRIREGHRYFDRLNDAGLLKPIEVQYDLEQATAAPGEKRGEQHPPKPEDLSKLKQPELKARLDEAGIEYPKGRVSNAELVELLTKKA